MRKNPVQDDLDENRADSQILGYIEDLLFITPGSLPDWLIVQAEDGLDRIAEHPVDKLYTAIRKNMLKVSRRFFAKRTSTPRPTIYSSRHQGTANLKLSGKSPEEIAAILGHKITRTHQVHYAKGNKGEGTKGLIFGDQQDIERVRQFSEEREVRIERNRINGTALSPEQEPQPSLLKKP